MPLVRPEATTTFRGRLVSIHPYQSGQVTATGDFDTYLVYFEDSPVRVVHISRDRLYQYQPLILPNIPLFNQVRSGEWAANELNILLDVTIDPKSTVTTDLGAAPRLMSVSGVAVAVEPTPNAEKLSPQPLPPFYGFTPISNPRVKPGQMRIGYAVFDNPVHTIAQQRQTHIEQMPIMRGTGTLKKGLGRAVESYTISYTANGPEEIKSSVQEVLEQIQLFPFLSVEGGPFPYNYDTGSEVAIPYQAIAVRHFTVATMPGFPNTLNVQINFEPFLWEWFTPPNQGPEESTSSKPVYPREKFDDLFCWPLFKLWAKTRKTSTYNGQEFDGRFVLQFPDPSVEAKLESLAATMGPEQESTDIHTLRSFISLLDKENAFSKNVKEITPATFGSTRLPNEPRYLVVKLWTKQTWDHIQSKLAESGLANFAGYILWDRLVGTNYADDTGTFLPLHSNVVSSNWLTETLPQGTPVAHQPKGFPGVVDVRPTLFTDSTLENQLTDLASRIPVTFNYQGLSATQTAARWKESPWTYFALVYRVDSPNSVSALKRGLQSIIEKRSKNSIDVFTSLNETLVEVFKVDANAPSIDVLVTNSPDNPENDGNIIIEQMGGTRGHNLATYSGQTDPLPLHTYMGGQDCVFNVEGKCFGSEAKRKLEALKEEWDLRSLGRVSSKHTTDERRRQLNKRGSAFLRVKNELFALLGIEFVVPVTIDIQNVEGQPNVWQFSMSFMEFDVALRRYENVRFLPTTMQRMGKAYQQGLWSSVGKSSPITDRARDMFSLQASLTELEVYPDMQLPTRGELDSWINLCIEASKVWSEKSGKISSFKGTRIPGFEAELANYLLPFMPAHAQTIKTWTPTSGGSASDPGNYVDPDFMCYYDPNQTWEAMFDKVVEQTMGNIKADYTADGATDPALMRYIDDTHRVSTLVEGRFHALKDFENTTEATLKERTFPEERRQVWDIARKANEDFDAKWADKIWWGEAVRRTGYTIMDGQPVVVATSVDDENAMSTGALVPRQVYSPRNLTEENAIYDDSTYNWYYDLSTRQVMAELVMTEDIIPTARVEDKLPENFLLPNGIVGQQLLERMTDEIGNNPPSRIFLREFIRQIDNRLDILGLLSTRNHWLKVTVQRTGDFAYLKGLDSLPAITTKLDDNTTETRIRNTFRFIDQLAIRESIDDPHVLRSILLRRDGFGSLSPSTTPETSFGDFDVVALSAYKVKETGFGRPLAQIVKAYRRWMNEYDNVPSVALIALHMELETIARRKYWDDNTNRLKADIHVELKKASQQIARGKRMSLQTREVISTLANRFSDVGTLLDQYFTGYINLCRVYGAYKPNAGQVDPYFYGLHGLVLMDVENNDAFIKTRYSPTGQLVVIDALRTQADAYPAEFRLYGYDTEKFPFKGIRYAANYVKRLRVGLSPKSDTSIYGHLLDMRRCGAFGRLLGAFPAFQVLLINEGFYWLAGNVKLWDQYYTRTGIASIEVFRTKTDPAATCTVTFSNMFHRISAYTQAEAMLHEFARHESEIYGKFAGFPGGKIGTPLPINVLSKIGDLWAHYFSRDTDEELLRIWQNSHLKQLALNVGTRIQVRMGYGSNAGSLPTVFNGSVVSAPVDEGYVTLVCVSDGAELKNQSTTKLVPTGNAYAFSDGGAFGIGKDPASIITEALVAGGTWDTLFQGNFRDWSHGIAHFGDIYYEGFKYFPAEMQINIYSSNPTKLEQSLPSWLNYFNFAALYNFNHSHLFSIEVQEPTPWKVISTCKNACLDFVASAEWFGTRSSLFFGKWWWPYHYTYHPDILLSGKFSGFSRGVGDLTERAQEAHITLQAPAESIDGETPASLVRQHSSGNSVYTPTLADILIAPSAIYKSVKDIYDYFTKPGDDVLAKLKEKAPSFQIMLELPDVVIRHLFDEYPTIKGTGCYQVYISNDHQIKNDILITESLVLYTDNFVTAEKSFVESNLKAVYFITMANQILHKEDLTHAQAEELATGSRPSGVKAAVTAALASVLKVNPLFSNYASEIAQGLGPLVWRIFGGGELNLSAPLDPVQVDFMQDVEELVQFLRWKPYMQAYVAHSMFNLLQNDVVASKQYVYTDAQGVHTYNGWLSGDSMVRTITYSIDTDIQMSERRTMLVPTGIVTTGMQEGLGRSISEGLLTIGSYVPMVGAVPDAARQFIQMTPSTPAIENSVVSALCESAKEMYQGWFTIMGMPTIKPHDLIALNDHILDMRGPVFVKEVIHKMDTQTGFLTIISPDCVAMPHSAQVGSRTVQSLMTGVLHRAVALWTFKAFTAATFGALKQNVLRTNRLGILDDFRRYSDILDRAKERANQGHFIDWQVNVGNALENKFTTELAEIRKLDGSIPDSDLTQRVNDLLDKHTRIRDKVASVDDPENIFNFLYKEGYGGVVSQEIDKLPAEDKTLLRILSEDSRLRQQQLDTMDLYDNGDILKNNIPASEAYRSAERQYVEAAANFVQTDPDLGTMADNLTAGAGLGPNLSPAVRQTIVKTSKDRIDTILSELASARRAKDFAREARLSTELDLEIARLIKALDSKNIKGTDVDRALRNLITNYKRKTLSVGPEIRGWLVNILESTFDGTITLGKAVPKTAKELARLTFLSATRPVGFIKWLSDQFESSKGALKDRKAAEVFREIQKTAETVWAPRVGRTAREIVAGARMLSYATPLGWVRLALDASLFIIGGEAINSINSRFRARQAVKIIPLMTGGVPFTAGIRGHAGAVLGDDASWVDKFWENLFSVDDVFSAKGIGFLAGSLITPLDLMSLEVPKYSSHGWTNQAYLPYIQDQQADQIADLKTQPDG